MICRFVIIFLLFYRSTYPSSVFESLSFYQELSKRVGDSDKRIISNLIQSEVYQDALNSRNIVILRQLETKGIIGSWAKHKSVVKKFLDERLLYKSEKKLYFYLRDAFREIGRGVVDKNLIEAIKSVIRSDYLALLSDVQFRILIQKLNREGCLVKFYQVIGDLVKIYGNQDFVDRWESAVDKRRSVDNSSEAELRISTLLKLSDIYAGSLMESARHIRDSGFFEVFYTEAVQKIVQGDLYRVFFSYFKKDNLGPNLQLLMENDLLMKALRLAQKKSANHMRKNVLELKDVAKASKLAFLGSLGYQAFISPNYIAELLFLDRNGLLSNLPVILGDLLKLSDSKFQKDYDDIKEFLYLRSKASNRQLNRVEKQQSDRDICHENMLKIMQKRANYNLMYRESINLNNIEARKRLLRMFAQPQQLKCPVDGVYRTTEYGWVYCSVHGRSPVPKYE